MLPKKPSFIIFRTDRVGDVVLSSHIPTAIKHAYPDAHITFVVRPYTRALLAHHPHIDEIVTVDDNHSIKNALKARRYDAAIVLFSTFSIAWNIFRARIPLRIGPFSKWWALFFNIPVVQKRSQCTYSEGAYNLDMLTALGIHTHTYPQLYRDVNDSIFRDAYFSEHNILHTAKLIILHPGSGHSAKNWPVEKFLSLARMLKDMPTVKILITGNKAELERYALLLEKHHLELTDCMPEALPLSSFLNVLSGAAMVITNSTGPLHCAVALGIKTVSMFCPIHVCSPTRWGPYTHDMNNHIVITPDVPTCTKCTQKKCAYFNCMERITVEEVYTKARVLLER